MSLDTANLVLENLVVEARLKFSLSRRRGGDILGVLSAAEADVVLPDEDGGAVERGIGHVGLEHLEVLGGDELVRERRCINKVSSHKDKFI